MINGPDYTCFRVVAIEREDGVRPGCKYHHTDPRLALGDWEEADERLDEIKKVNESPSHAS